MAATSKVAPSLSWAAAGGAPLRLTVSSRKLALRSCVCCGEPSSRRASSLAPRSRAHRSCGAAPSVRWARLPWARKPLSTALAPLSPTTSPLGTSASALDPRPLERHMSMLSGSLPCPHRLPWPAGTPGPRPPWRTSATCCSMLAFSEGCCGALKMTE